MSSLEHLPALARSGRETGRWRRWTGALLDLVFPPFCAVCREPLSEERRGPLCTPCWEALERIGEIAATVAVTAAVLASV